jgi:hypothetical protein
MKKFLLPILLGICLHSSAQNYTREAGIRAGVTSGLTYRQYINDNLSYEGLMSFRKSGIQFTLLRQIHELPIFEVSHNLFLLYGYGGHVGFFNDYEYNIFLNSYVYYSERKFTPVGGVDGFGALEYRLDDLPLSFCVDFKPYFEISAYQFFKINLWDFAFALKYRF